MAAAHGCCSIAGEAESERFASFEKEDTSPALGRSEGLASSRVVSARSSGLYESLMNVFESKAEDALKSAEMFLRFAVRSPLDARTSDEI